MSQLYVPNTVVQEQRASMIREQIERNMETFRYWNQKLKEIDTNLELVRASETASLPELKPGYWHVIRKVAGSPASVFVHENPETGAYMEPNSHLLDRLARGDMWNDRAQKDREKRIKRAQKAAKREEEREREDRVEEISQRLRSRMGTQIAVSKAV